MALFKGPEVLVEEASPFREADTKWQEGWGGRPKVWSVEAARVIKTSARV